MSNPTITFDGETIELACTLDAADKLSQLMAQNPVAGSGPRALALRAYSGDLESIAIAIGIFVKKPLREIKQKVWDAGSASFSVPVSEFYMRLSNGGRPLVEPKGEVEDESERPQKPGKA